ncbi:MAG: MOSC domain-containing protein [Limisphaerales bacterium]
MNATFSGQQQVPGRVVSLHLHPEKAGQRMTDTSEIEVVVGKGIVGEPRYFERKNRSGQPSRRNVTLIEREIIAQHAETLKANITPGLVKSNVETAGVDLVSLIGNKVQIGDAILNFYEPRLPCDQMDRIIPGMRLLMCDKRQGVIAEIVKSGRIKIGDELRIVE